MDEAPVQIGTRTCGADVGRPQRRAVRHDGWTDMRRGRFLEHLALTANVKASADAAGMTKSSAGKLRRLCPEFRAQWDAALEEGYRALEEQLLARAIAGTELADPPADCDLRRIEQSNRLALTLLARHAERGHDRVAERLAEMLPGLRVTRTAEGVAIEGRRLGRDTRLCWIGALIR